jgi:hypothetical protein
LVRFHNLWDVIVFARLKQQDADIRVFRKTTRHH